MSVRILLCLLCAAIIIPIQVMDPDPVNNVYKPALKWIGPKISEFGDALSHEDDEQGRTPEAHGWFQ